MDMGPNYNMVSAVSTSYLLDVQQSWRVDSGRRYDFSQAPSHGHLAIFECDENGNLSGRRIPPLDVLNSAYIEDFGSYP